MRRTVEKRIRVIERKTSNVQVRCQMATTTSDNAQRNSLVEMRRYTQTEMRSKNPEITWGGGFCFMGDRRTTVWG